jgi:hypothetical protein
VLKSTFCTAPSRTSASRTLISESPCKLVPVKASRAVSAQLPDVRSI